MDCPSCGHATVAFRVPEPVREHAPGETAAICTRCLTLDDAGEPPGEPDFSTLIDAFPEGEAGAAMALGVGLIVDADPQFPDPAAARVLLEDGIEPLTGVDVGTEKLLDQAEQIADAKAELAQQMQQGGDESTQAKPLGMYQ